MSKKEWFAVKRTKASKTYQFYAPNKRNREIIDAIAPDGGNYEVIVLIEQSRIVVQNIGIAKNRKGKTKKRHRLVDNYKPETVGDYMSNEERRK